VTSGCAGCSEGRSPENAPSGTQGERELNVGRYRRPKWTGQAVLSTRWNKTKFEVIKFAYGTWMNVLVSGSYVLETSPS